MIKKFKLEVIVFLCGAGVMILELVGSRVIAPYAGASIYVWASLIGVVLGSLSLGYWWGGKIADKNPTYQGLALVIFLAAIFIGTVALVKALILAIIGQSITDIRLGSLLLALVLFAPPSILLGMVSPYAVKLRVNNLQTSGRTVGNLYAISTVGSIVGTLATGFWLLAYLGNTNILYVLSGLFMVTALLADSGGYAKKIGLMTVAILLLSNIFYKASRVADYIDLDSQYSRIIIYKSTDRETGRPVRVLATDGQSVQSGVFLDKDDDLVFLYTKYYRLASHFQPNIKSALMIGGGAFSYPKDFLQRFPTAQMDVVEIDPRLTKLARQYFNFQDNPRLSIYNEDGRTFLNRTKNSYDVIYVDAFHSMLSVPYELTTRQAVQAMDARLSAGGAVLVNLASGIEGAGGKFLRAEYATFKSIFPKVYLFPVSDKNDAYKVQNVMLVALKSGPAPAFNSADPELNEYLGHIWQKPVTDDLPVLTDDRAPVDYYLMGTI